MKKPPAETCVYLAPSSKAGRLLSKLVGPTTQCFPITSEEHCLRAPGSKTGMAHRPDQVFPRATRRRLGKAPPGACTDLRVPRSSLPGGNTELTHAIDAAGNNISVSSKKCRVGMRHFIPTPALNQCPSTALQFMHYHHDTIGVSSNSPNEPHIEGQKNCA